MTEAKHGTSLFETEQAFAVPARIGCDLIRDCESSELTRCVSFEVERF